MGIIQCAEDCKYQNDGYCSLDKCSNINSLNNSCPYFIKRSLDKGNSLSEISNTDKFHSFGTISNLLY